MRLTNSDGLLAQSTFDQPGVIAPWFWYDQKAVDGTTFPWSKAPIGSMYWLTAAGNVTVYFKRSDNEATSDWVSIVTSSGGSTLAARFKTTDGVGAVVAGKATAVEYGDGTLHQTVLTLTLTGANDLDLAGDADNSKGVKVYDLPAGRIHVLGATIDASVTVNNAFNASTNDVFYMSVGSGDATQAANADLTSTEADLIPKTTLDTVGNTTLTLPWKTALAAAAQFDGTTTPIDVFVNAAVANASTSKAVTVAVTGTLTIYWINLGDY